MSKKEETIQADIIGNKSRGKISLKKENLELVQTILSSEAHPHWTFGVYVHKPNSMIVFGSRWKTSADRFYYYVDQDDFAVNFRALTSPKSGVTGEMVHSIVLAILESFHNGLDAGREEEKNRIYQQFVEDRLKKTKVRGKNEYKVTVDIEPEGKDDDRPKWS